MKDGAKIREQGNGRGNLTNFHFFPWSVITAKGESLEAPDTGLFSRHLGCSSCIGSMGYFITQKQFIW